MKSVMPEVVCAGVCFWVEKGGNEEERGGRCVGGVVGWQVMRTWGIG
jgi:hypothetical protein